MIAQTRRRGWYLSILAVLAVSAVAVFSACGDDDDDASPPAASATSSTSGSTIAVTATPVPLEGEITVFAASSLTDAFKEAATKFQEKNPKTKVTFSFGSSSSLATQINEGAPADVFASADTAQMKVVTDKGNAADPTIFVTNLPTIVVPRSGSPVTSFADLAKSGIKLVLAGPEVPVGKYARDVLTNASKSSGGISPDFSDKVLANLKSNEANVRAVLTKIQLGEADAGMVYSSDTVAAPDLQKIEIATENNVVAKYPVAALSQTRDAELSQAFIAYVLSPEGQAILQKCGFLLVK
jgi:molybdate transport system substrate-binding protein